MYNVLSAGVDWLTLSETLGVGEVDSELVDMWSFYDAVGNETSEVRFGGYSGERISYAGDGTLTFGSRVRDGYLDAILVASGPFGQALAELYAMRGRRGDERATRIDVRVDVELDEPNKNLGRTMYKAYRDGLLSAGKRKLSMVDSTSGQTLYVGSRRSRARFYRVYDKSSHYNRQPGSVWRFEVQLGRRYADSALGHLVEDVAAGRGISGIAGRLTIGAFSLIDMDIAAGLDGIEDLGASSIESSTAKRMAWLARCVAPVILRLLMDRVDWREILRVLKLGDVVNRP